MLEMKLMLEKLEANQPALAEMLLYVYYVLNGHSDYQATGDTCLGCLCRFSLFQVRQLNNFQYFSDSSSCSLKKDGDHLVCVKHCSIHMDSPPTPAVFIFSNFLSNAHSSCNVYHEILMR